MDYFISDTHIGHKRMLLSERKHFSTIQEHDTMIFDMLSKLRSDDTLYHLGDVGHLTPDVIEFFKELPCKKILVRGNHDEQSAKLQEMFDEVKPGPFYYNSRVLLSHYPHPVPKGNINIHGHLHGADLASEDHVCISLAVNGYRMLTEKDISRLCMSRSAPNTKFLEEWFAPMYRFIDKNKAGVIMDENNVVKLKETLEMRATRNG